MPVSLLCFCLLYVVSLALPEIPSLLSCLVLLAGIWDQFLRTRTASEPCAPGCDRTSWGIPGPAEPGHDASFMPTTICYEGADGKCLVVSATLRSRSLQLGFDLCYLGTWASSSWMALAPASSLDSSRLDKEVSMQQHTYRSRKDPECIGHLDSLGVMAAKILGKAQSQRKMSVLLRVEAHIPSLCAPPQATASARFHTMPLKNLLMPAEAAAKYSKYFRLLLHLDCTESHSVGHQSLCRRRK